MDKRLLITLAFTALMALVLSVRSVHACQEEGADVIMASLKAHVEEIQNALGVHLSEGSPSSATKEEARALAIQEMLSPETLERLQLGQ